MDTAAIRSLRESLKGLRELWSVKDEWPVNVRVGDTAGSVKVGQLLDAVAADASRLGIDPAPFVKLRLIEMPVAAISQAIDDALQRLDELEVRLGITQLFGTIGIRCSDAKALGKLADSLDEAKRELVLAQQQSTRSSHLYVRSRRTAVQACRAIKAAVDLGFHQLCPFTKLWGGQSDDDTTIDDRAAFSLWTNFVCPSLISRHATPRADAGDFDFPAIKTDQQGRILDRDGKPLEIVPIVDDDGKVIGEKLGGPAGKVTDDYDDADTLEHLRCRTADWADACGVAADLIREYVSNQKADGLSARKALIAELAERGERVKLTLSANFEWVEVIVGSDGKRREPTPEENAVFSGSRYVEDSLPWLSCGPGLSNVADVAEPTPAPPDCHVGLMQMAAMVNRSKRTLEHLRDNGKLPAPAVKGGKGKADEWKWSDVRPILEEQYGRSLPEEFPADRFIRR